ncbi:MAG: hypothetical protein RLZZ262_45 [Bacteroidota bacterium]|jgi:hypothetical protein
MRAYLFVVLLFGFSATMRADSLHFVFRPLVNGAPLLLNQPMRLNEMSVEWQTIRLYVGGFSTSNDALETYYLLGTGDEVNHFDIKLPLKVRQGDHVNYCVGVDSTTQVAGAMRGDLDPQHGMYWAWQSGYISIKLEGKSTTADGKVQNFVYHLGGYREGVCAHELFGVVDENDQIVFAPDLGQWFADIYHENVLHLMSPGPVGLKWFVQLFITRP